MRQIVFSIGPTDADPDGAGLADYVEVGQHITMRWEALDVSLVPGSVTRNTRSSRSIVKPFSVPERERYRVKFTSSLLPENETVNGTLLVDGTPLPYVHSGRGYILGTARLDPGDHSAVLEIGGNRTIDLEEFLIQRRSLNPFDDDWGDPSKNGELGAEVPRTGHRREGHIHPRGLDAVSFRTDPPVQ